MSRVTQARRIATAAAYGGGGLVGIGAATLGVLLTEARIARRAVGPRTGVPPYIDGRYGPRHGTSIRLVVLGDSSAAGLGAASPQETVGGVLAAGIVEALGRPVLVTNVAVVGAESRDLPPQIDRALLLRPHVAVILIGGNDITHRRRPQSAVRHLQEGVHRLRENDTAVVVATAPDLGTIRPVPQPLRWVARRLSRQLAAAQTIAVVEAGGRSVSLGDLLGPEFEARPDEMFSADRFHPSGVGYTAAARALLPSVLASLGVPDPEGTLEPLRTGDVMPVAMAAVEAAATAGTEVAPTQIGSHARGPRGRWAALRHRVRRPAPTPLAPDPLPDPQPQPSAPGTAGSSDRPHEPLEIEGRERGDARSRPVVPGDGA